MSQGHDLPPPVAGIGRRPFLSRESNDQREWAVASRAAARKWLAAPPPVAGIGRRPFLSRESNDQREWAVASRAAARKWLAAPPPVAGIGRRPFLSRESNDQREWAALPPILGLLLVSWIVIALLPALLGAACGEFERRHPISLTEATVYVQQTRISVAIEVFVEDLYLFHNLEPDEENFLLPDDIRAGADLHEQFLLDRFTLRDLRGERLEGVVEEVSELEIPPEGIPMGELMQHSITYKLEYLPNEPPEFLTIVQDFVDDSAGIPAEMQLRLKQEGSDSPSFAVLPPGEPFTARFSWDHPPLSVEASEEEWEEWIEQQREETLGITSYSSVYSFIYIEDREVRHEILVPLVTLESSVLIARDDDAFLSLEEQDAAYDQIAAYFKAGNPVEINGQIVPATVERLDFFGLDFKDFAQQAQRRKVSTANARVGIILRYPARQPPEQVKVTWDQFNRHIWSVQSVVYAYEDVSRVTFSRFGNEREFTWSSPGRPALPEIVPVAIAEKDSPVRQMPLVALGCLAVIPVVLVVLRTQRLPTRLSGSRCNPARSRRRSHLEHRARGCPVSTDGRVIAGGRCAAGL